MPTIRLQDIYGSPGGGMRANPQSQAGTGTATTVTGAANASTLATGSLGWWLALVAGLVVVRVIYEVKAKEA